MRLHRFYVDQTIVSGADNTFSGAELAHQLRRVFRLQVGDKALFFDGSGIDHVSDIVSMTKDGVTFHAGETIPTIRHTDKRVSLALSLIKKDNFEWVIQKGTELGVSEFIPLVSERSEKKGFNMERARKIMIEAVEQSGRGDIPTISEPVALEDFLATEKRSMVAFHTDEKSQKLATDALPKEVVALIGPEGGWSENEVALFSEKGIACVKLDSPVLRAETAAIAIATLLLLR